MASVSVVTILTTACGVRTEQLQVKQKEPVGPERTPNPLAAGDEAIRQGFLAARWASAVAVQKQQQEAAAVQEATPQAPTEPAVTVTPSTGVNWDCVAEAETGSDYSMHGSTYSTAYGMINSIIYQYATPEVAAKIMSGQGTKADELPIAEAFAADNGTGGWGVLTRQKCGL